MATRTTTTRTTNIRSVVSGDGFAAPMPAELTLESLFDAYFDCRRRKRNTQSQLAFEVDLERNLMGLWRDLEEGSYSIGPSIAFVVRQPRVREVWAADFRDRIVHHLIYNAISPRFMARFIRDSYACIPGRGTHDGMRRISGFARSVSRNWTRPAFVLKADVANFFTSIDRRIVLEQVFSRVPEPWLRRLVAQVLMHDPRAGVVRQSSPREFALVPRHKSLLFAPDGFGLPIGNLTSQFFANVHLDAMDQHVKRDLKVRMYGRYVDDMVLFGQDREWLESCYLDMSSFLREGLGLAFHPGKKMLYPAHQGIDFAGFVIKPGRTYVRNATMRRAKRRIGLWMASGEAPDGDGARRMAASLTSTLGQLRQVDGYRARRAICRRVESLFVRADAGCTRLRVA